MKLIHHFENLYLTSALISKKKKSKYIDIKFYCVQFHQLH